VPGLEPGTSGSRPQRRSITHASHAKLYASRTLTSVQSVGADAYPNELSSLYKVKWPLFLAEHCAIRAYRDSGGTALPIINSNTD
jgi:hypothetical protein